VDEYASKVKEQMKQQAKAAPDRREEPLVKAG
jgi:hypothetical protein